MSVHFKSFYSKRNLSGYKIVSGIRKNTRGNNNMLKETTHKNKISQTKFTNGIKDFLRVEQNFQEDNESRKRKRKMQTSLTQSVEEALQTDKRATVRGLADIFGASYGTVYRIRTE